MPIYADQASTSWPKPEVVYKTVDNFLRHLGGNPGRSGHGHSIQAMRVVLDARESLTQLFGAADPREIVFTLNATDALNMAIKGMLQQGGHVVTTSMEHNSMMRPLVGLAEAGVITLTEVQAGREGRVSVEDMAAAIRPETVLVAMTHASNVVGAIQPVAEVGAIAKRHGVTFLVDAAQTAGALPIDVREANIDLLAFAGHKGLLGPQGTGGLYIRNGVPVAPWREGGTGTQSELDHMPELLPDRMEAGTPNTPGIAGLGAAVEHILEIGVDKIREVELALTARFLDGLTRIPRVIVYGPKDPNERVAVVSLNLEGLDNGILGQILEEYEIMVRTGLHCAPHAHRTIGTFPVGAVRFSFHHSNTMEDIDRVLEVLAQIAAQS
jgi:cysteine desulfurase family protein